MDSKGKERGILKLEPRPRIVLDYYRYELTPQGSNEHPPVSPQPSVDRLSVTWADPSSMASSGVNLFHLPSETPVTNEVKFSPTTADGSEDEDYSASLSAVLRQRRASVRRSRKGRARRPSSPFLPDENRPRRRSSVFTTSSGDTAISMEDAPAIVTQEQIFENIHLHKEVLGSVKQQPLGMRRKLKLVHQAKGYIKRHEGQLQERLAQSKSTRDIYARFNILLAAKWQQMKREAANTSNLLIPWELRIKEIESHFGSVVASYFTFLRWLFWVNLVIGFILLVFVIVPECLTANPKQDGERKIIRDEELPNATNLLTLWEFEGALKFSPIFYGYYSNIERIQYRMPLAYFLTGFVVYIYSFVAILRKMAENSRMSKLSEKEDECIFSWKLFTGWDFMIGNAETAHNRIASVILGFKEALLEEAEKKKDLRNWRIISLRALVNMCVLLLLALSAYAVVTVVSRTDDNTKTRNWWRENETTIVVTVISITFPVFFELLGFLEHYHPRKQLRLQLARIMLLNLLNLYSLIFALFSKIERMSLDLNLLKPTLQINATIISNDSLRISESLVQEAQAICTEHVVPCGSCTPRISLLTADNIRSLRENAPKTGDLRRIRKNIQPDFNIILNQNTNYASSPYTERYSENIETTTIDENKLLQDEMTRLRKLALLNNQTTTDFNNSSDRNKSSDTSDYDEYTFEDYNYTFTDADNNMSRNVNYENKNTLYTVTSLSADYSTAITQNTETIQENTSTDETTTFGLIMSSTEYPITSNETSEIVIAETTETYPSTDIDNNRSDNETQNTDISLITTYSTIETNVPTDSETSINSDMSTSDFFTTETNFLDSNKDLVQETTTPILFDVSSTYETTFDSILEYTEHSTLLTFSDKKTKFCPELYFNCSMTCGNKTIIQVFVISNCTLETICYEKKCELDNDVQNVKKNQTNMTTTDIAYLDEYHIIQYNLTTQTRKKLLKLCWETMFGQELIKLTMMDLVFVLLGTLFMDFFRALFVRYMNRCWCWDLEKKFPEYGDFKIAENILHLINNQGMVWMGMFFSPGLVVLNVVKLMIMMYLRSWAVMTCNVPHEVVFRVSKSNNFYLALLLTMLFLCVLPVGYSIVWVKPSWHCGPFSEYDRIYYILTNKINTLLPPGLNFTLEYIASPAIVIPLLVLLILIIYYLTSLTNSLREANNDLKIQLRRERTEERRKMFQLADTRRRAGSTAMDNTPFARWKKALPSLPLSKSIDSDDRKTCDENTAPLKTIKKKGGIFAKIVNMALDKKPDASVASDLPSPGFGNIDDETDTDFHETLPKEILKAKDITIVKHLDHKKKNIVEFKTCKDVNEKAKSGKNLDVKLEGIDDRTEKKAVVEKQHKYPSSNVNVSKSFKVEEEQNVSNENRKINEKQMSESSTQSKQSDSIGSVIPVIMISTTESDEEVLQMDRNTKTKEKKRKDYVKGSRAHNEEADKKIGTSEAKSLRRQSSVDSIQGDKTSKDIKSEEGHSYQYSL